MDRCHIGIGEFMSDGNQPYSGEERRSGAERREDFCGRCSGIMRGLEDVVAKNKANCENLEKTQDRMDKKFTAVNEAFENKCIQVEAKVDAKVPMKLFYVMVGLIVAILGFQWTTYEKMNSTALKQEHATGELASTTREIKTAIQGHQNLNKIEIHQLKNAVDQHQSQIDRELEEVVESIKEIERAMK
jgi:hypothetical protein